MLHTELHRCFLIGQHHANKIIVRRTSRLSLMPGQPKILEYLHSHDCCTQKEIGEGCFLDKSTVTSLLSRMESTGLICKSPHPSDGRVTMVTLTEKGRRLAGQVLHIMADTDTLAWKGIPEAERENFLCTFNKIIQNLQKWKDDKE